MANSKKKYEPVDTREFVDYKELFIENIKEACEKFFEAPRGSCDVLLTDRGPSCYLTDQIVYYVWFVDPEKDSIKLKKGTMMKSRRMLNLLGKYERSFEEVCRNIHILQKPVLVRIPKRGCHQCLPPPFRNRCQLRCRSLAGKKVS